jgi:cell wall-associated NlpC family hydrolase/prophage tail gpP-like protein
VRVHAVITADTGNRQKRQVTISRIEAYAISTAMDTDADEFSIDISDPQRELGFLLDRDTEVLVSLFSKSWSGKSTEQLHQGIADSVSFSTQDQVISIKGRDYSSVAADSQAPPVTVAVMRPHIFIRNEAKSLGIADTQLSTATYLKKFERDGSETYWESWYRICRNKKMWLWAEPSGKLVSGYLNYDEKPAYYFGRPTAGVGNPSSWIKVEKLEVTKSTTSRIGGIWVYGVHEKNNVGFRYPPPPQIEPLRDQTINGWVRRPLKIITSTRAKNVGDARDEAYEEIFEGKVGAVEIVLTVATELVVHQNEMAYVNVPEAGVKGLFYIVGITREGGMDGSTQSIRLREKFYAISGRIPPDPEEEEDPGLEQTAPGDIKAQLPGIRWGNAFAAAALQYHGGWDYKLFLGVLLAICDQESGFSNCIQGKGGVDWYPPPEVGASVPPTPGTPGVPPQSLAGWKKIWDNEEKTLGPGNAKGVGPMQLTTLDYKLDADDQGGKRDEWQGGRWIPEYNIMAGAHAFKTKCDLYAGDSSVDSNIWIGVQAYNGAGQAAINYRNQVKRLYDSKYKDTVQAVQITGKPGEASTDKGVEGEPELIQKFVAVALQQIGKPYAWGHEGPNDFDCSGLVDYAARQVGLAKVYRNGRGSTHTYWTDKTFTEVRRDDLLHGDLVFFDAQEHMGIYLSRGIFLHAPHTGDVVKKSSLNSGWYKSQYDGARRIIPWHPTSDVEANTTGNAAGIKIAIFHNGDWEWKDGTPESGPAGGNWLGNAYALWLEKNPDEDPKDGSTVAVSKADR